MQLMSDMTIFLMRENAHRLREMNNRYFKTRAMADWIEGLVDHIEALQNEVVALRAVAYPEGVVADP